MLLCAFAKPSMTLALFLDWFFLWAHRQRATTYPSSSWLPAAVPCYGGSLRFQRPRSSAVQAPSPGRAAQGQRFKKKPPRSDSHTRATAGQVRASLPSSATRASAQPSPALISPAIQPLRPLAVSPSPSSCAAPAGFAVVAKPPSPPLSAGELRAVQPPTAAGRAVCRPLCG